MKIDKWKNLKTWTKILVLVLLSAFILQIVSLIIAAFTSLGYLESLRIVFGSVYVLFLPGFILSYIFFDNRGEKKLDAIERIALSFALSIAVVPLVVFYLNLIGMKINALNSFFVVLAIIILGLIIVKFKSKKVNKFGL